MRGPIPLSGWMHAAGALLLAMPIAAAALPAWADDGPPSFAPLVHKVLPGVVSIAVTEPLNTNEALDALPPALRGTPFEKQFREQLRRRP